MDMMESKAIETMVNGMKPGTFFRIKYKTVPQLNKEGKKHEIYKITATTVRTGVHYNKIKGVEVKGTGKDWCSYQNAKHPAIAVHNTTGKQYLTVYPTAKGTHTKTAWFLDGRVHEFDEVKQYLYSTSKSDTKIYRVSLENIVDIKQTKKG